jgi:uncharacterized protein YeaO (DUF488 family)
MIKIKRAYDPAEPQDGLRILVDRLWPRGISKDALKLDLWLRGAAPSDALRKEYHHDVSRWEEFRTRYAAELESNQEALEPLIDMASKGDMTLVYAAKDREHNNAVVLKEYLEARPGS